MPQIFRFVLYPILLGSSFFSDFASTTTCRVYPSEYAYRDDSVTRTESASANCRKYPRRDGDMGIKYIHCDGVTPKLSDSGRGSNAKYTATSYYEWNSGSAKQMLFIFPLTVSLTTITLHYYSDRVRGLPRLIFYAVPDDFNVWDALTTNYPNKEVASVSPGGDPEGTRSVSINVNFSKKRILMYKFSSNFKFAVSEVEFFMCVPITTSVASFMTIAIKDNIATTELKDFTTNNTTIEQVTVDAKTSQATTLRSPQTQGALQPTAMVAVGVVGALLLILITSLIIILSLIVWHRKRGTRKLEIDSNSGSMREDASYSILERGTRQQIQPQDSKSTELYDQIHLSPSTGQTELISKTESETAEDISIPQSNIYSNVDMENSQPISSCEPEKSTLEDATYAVVNKKKKKKKLKGASHDNANKIEKTEEEVEVQEQLSLDDMYAVVQKKPKKSEEQGETPPPIFAPTVESLYTAVQKIP